MDTWPGLIGEARGCRLAGVKRTIDDVVQDLNNMLSPPKGAKEAEAAEQRDNVRTVFQAAFRDVRKNLALPAKVTSKPDIRYSVPFPASQRKLAHARLARHVVSLVVDTRKTRGPRKTPVKAAIVVAMFEDDVIVGFTIDRDAAPTTQFKSINQSLDAKAIAVLSDSSVVTDAVQKALDALFIALRSKNR
jgi:hypothetical protein